MQQHIFKSICKMVRKWWCESCPLLADDKFENVQKLLSQLNGVLFTGGTGHMAQGNIWWDQLNNIMSYLIKYHNESPSKSQAIPLWSTCLGFQAMLSWTAGHMVTTN